MEHLGTYNMNVYLDGLTIKGKATKHSETLTLATITVDELNELLTPLREELNEEMSKHMPNMDMAVTFTTKEAVEGE